MSLFESLTVENTEPLLGTDSDWHQNGVTILPNFMPHDLIDNYVAERRTLLFGNKWRTGWHKPTPYLHVKSMRDLALYAPLMEKLKERIEDTAGLHLTLTGFQSTERAPHQDRYLNPEKVGQKYVAVWIACDDIHPDAGPFTYVPGSHKWRVFERRKVQDYEMERTGRVHPDTWPTDTQDFVGTACNEETLKQNVEKVAFIPKKGDVLIWHSSLVHEGSIPKDKTLQRPALICHYSSIHHRPDMLNIKEHDNGEKYFNFGHALD